MFSLLQTGLVIVDSPGVGDTDEMTRLVTDYVMEASAFVFIINTIDGVQITRVSMTDLQKLTLVLSNAGWSKSNSKNYFLTNKTD